MAAAAVATPASVMTTLSKHKRVSYVIPAPTEPLPVLSLPPLDVKRRGRSSPVFTIDRSTASSSSSARLNGAAGNEQTHLRHRLPVQALALDMSTAIDCLPARNSSGNDNDDDAARPAPAGILYTGGRDGLVCAWELALPTRKRKRRYGAENDQDSDSDSDMQDVEDDADLAAGIELGSPTSSSRHSQRHASISSVRKANSLRPRKESSASTRNSRRSASGTVDPALPVEDLWEIDCDRLSETAPPRTTYRQGLQSHTDWVNDIALVNHGRTLVSVSSDSLVLAWNPHSASHEEQVTPKQLGSHADYIRCLAASRDAGWVASGGFDRKIKIWDVWEGRSTAALELPATPASIYSLAASHDGNMLACGSPERIVRVYDPRSRQQVARLNGHTDNVRGVLLSEDGQWLLSASSDSTVKLWSITAQKCLHTFAHHSSSVWSIFSQHPNLEIFYSGDKSGNICKIDLVGTGDPREGECILLARDAADENEPGDIPRGCEGITQLVARDDAFIWAASGSSSVKRWRDVPPRSRRSAPLRSKVELVDTAMPSESSELLLGQQSFTDAATGMQAERSEPRVTSPSVSFLEGLTSTLSRTTSSPSPRINAITGAQSTVHRPSSLRLRPSVSRPSNVNRSTTSVLLPASVTAGTTLFDIPYDSLVPLTLPDDNFFSPLFASRAKDPEIATIYSSVSALSQSVHRPMLSTSPSSVKRPTSIADTVQSEHQPVSMARRDFLERDSVSDCTPLRSNPDGVITGEHGLTRCEVLSDRRHVLTIDTDDKVALWDIIACRCIGVFEGINDARRPSDAVSSISGNGSVGSTDNSVDLIEYVRDRIECEASVAPWCKCDARVGALAVHLDESRVWEAEVYADDLGYDDYPVDFRLHLGKIVLRNLFDGFIEAEMALRQNGASQGRPNLRLSLSDLPPTSPGMRTAGMTIGLATPASSRAVLPAQPLPVSPRPALWDLTPIPQSPGTPRFQEPTGALGSPSATINPASAAARGEQDYFSLPTTSAPASPPTASVKAVESTSPAVPTSGGILMGRFKFLGKSKRNDAAQALPSISTVTAEAKETTNEPEPTPLDIILSKPITPCPPLEAPPVHYSDNMAIMIAEETGEGSAWAVTYRGLTSTVEEDARVIEQCAPLWLLDFLLGNRVQLRDPVKVSFVLQPWRDVETAGLPELPNANARLNANRNLRIRKVMAYVAEKLDLRKASRAPSISGASVSASASSQPATQTNSPVTTSASPALPTVQVNGSGSSSTGHKREDSEASTTMSTVSNGSEGGAYGGDIDPERDIEILCGDTLLHARMTLASVRSYYWKSGGDVVLSYRTPRADRPAGL